MRRISFYSTIDTCWYAERKNFYVSPSSISLLVKIERILFRSMTHQTFLPLFLQLSDLHHCSCMYTLRVSYRSSRRHGMPNFHFLYPCNKLVTALLWRLTFGKKFFFIYFLSKLYSTYRLGQEVLL